MVEKEFYIWHLLQLVEESFVETAPVDGGDVAAMDVVGLRGLGRGASRGETVDHAAVHGDCFGDDGAEKGGVVGVTEGSNAAFGEGEVDGFGEIERSGGCVAEV